MSNPKRNDPCPCGSGKKYKKCCGMSNVIEISPQLYNDELNQLHDDLLAYALGNYEEVFMEQTRSYFQPFLNEDTIATEDYLTGLTLWTILNVPLLKNDQTIFDAFYSQQKGKIKRTRTKNTFLEWANTRPSAYELLEVDTHGTEMATISEISTNEKFQVPAIDIDDHVQGTIIIGSLIPFVDFHHFFFEAIELIDVDKQEIISQMKVHSTADAQLNETFPDFLAAVLQISEVAVLGNPLHDLVAALYSKHMMDKGIDGETINLGIEIWQSYTLMEEPNFKKVEAYAAALEYLVQTIILENDTITQKKIAEEYGITAGTVSTNYRKLMSFVEETIEEAESPDNHSNGPVNMEREMRDLQKILSENEFDSLEDASDFIDHMLKNGDTFERTSKSPRDQAQDLLYDAQGAQGAQRKKLIEEALTIYPNSPDAFLLLAEDTESIIKYEENLKKAVQVGEKDLGKAFFLEHKGHFWMMIETRPYMRAKALYAEYLYESEAEEEALTHYEEMLRLNPNDNQGIRYNLLTLYIEYEQFNEAQELINQFSDEGTANFLFNKVLVDYLMNGFTNQTKALIKEANKQNPFVKQYLLGKKKIPNDYLHHIGFGDDTEALVYAQENIHLWEDYPELIKKL